MSLIRKHVESPADMLLIRKAEPRDAKKIIECMQSVMDEHIYFVSEYYLYTERGEQERLRNPDDLTLVASIGDKIPGVLTLQRGVYKKNRHTANLGIAVMNGYRKQGIGSGLIREALRWAGENGIKKVNLEVFSTNVNAIETYRKIGFVQEGARKSQFIINGEYVDDILMTYWIDPKIAS
ncbi:MAG: GNAT family N-acetyltransferase [Candidatus Thermoplasmatota archaeon]|nr:GNAT family N-acetyltransferase [Candidatus Thermoplasmatota archaeon]